MKNKPALFLSVFAIAYLPVSCAQHSPVAPAPGFTFDVFPLATGMHYTYSFYSRSEIHRTGWKIDSGLVEYRVKDSTLSNSGVKRWTVEETRHLWHRETYPPTITPYWVDTTVTISLSELLSDLHELRCNSLVWSFPLLQGLPETKAVFRYSGNPYQPVTSVRNIDDGAYVEKDSVELDVDSGLTFRAFSVGGWAMSVDEQYQTAQLMGRTSGSSSTMVGSDGYLPQKQKKKAGEI